MPKTALRAAQSPLLSPSPISPKSLPSPMYPASYDGSLRKQDRALVNSLNQRTWQPSPTSPASLTSPEERSPLVVKLEKISLLPPINFEMRDGLTACPPPETSPRGEYQQNPEGSKPITICGPLATRTRRSSSSTGHDPSPRRRRDSAVHPSPYHELRSVGHIHFGAARTADAFVIPRSLRRESNPFAGAPHSAVVPPQGDDGLPRLNMPNRLTVRIVIRPRAHERKLFKFEHSFDMDELRATVPDPPPPPPPPPTGSTGISSREPDRVWSSAAKTASSTAPKRRPSTARSNSTASVSPRDPRSGHGSDYRSLLTDPKTVPIHLRYARVFLPVLAGLLQLGDVRRGDIVYLPVPHAGAWHQTLRYVYTGQGEPTPAVRANIVYLAGKV
ncbi:hypothetical protein F5X99DRAFT_422187 [Biscogniauxia marginata]|nr:hypothetical protein F5X99DRAFT_422187 [Biscogniauxia marginata]